MAPLTSAMVAVVAAEVVHLATAVGQSEVVQVATVATVAAAARCR